MGVLFPPSASNGDGGVSSPGAESTGEGAVEAFPSPVVGHLLLPYGEVGPVVADAVVERREWGAVEDVGGLLGLQVGLEGGSGPFARHFVREPRYKNIIVVQKKQKCSDVQEQY